MPNQRSKNKIYLGGFLEKELHQQVLRLAKQAGMQNNKFGFAALLIEESIQRRLSNQARAAKLKAKTPTKVKAKKPAPARR